MRTGAGRKGNQEGQSLPTAMLPQGRSMEENPSCFLFQSSDVRPKHHVSQSQVQYVRKPGKFGPQDRGAETGHRAKQKGQSQGCQYKGQSNQHIAQLCSKLNDFGQGQI